MHLCFDGIVFPDHLAWFTKGYKFILQTLWTGRLLDVWMTGECLMTLEGLQVSISSDKDEIIDVKKRQISELTLARRCARS